MKRLDIKFTFQCNNFCEFCVQGNKRNLHENKSHHAIKKILSESRRDCDEVVFTGGEATLMPDFLTLVAHARGLGYRIQVQTNGRMFAYFDFCKKAVEAGAETFAISIHGHNAQLHDGLTNAKGSFEQSTLGIRHLLSLGKIVVTNTVINKRNYRHLPKIAETLIGLGVPQYQFAFPHILGNALKNLEKMIPRKTDIMPYVKKGIEVGVKHKRRVQVEAIPPCFLKGHEKCLTELSIPETKVFDINLVESFNHWRRHEGKCKGPRCHECRYFHQCEGPWREYPEHFGWDEFVPVK